MAEQLARVAVDTSVVLDLLVDTDVEKANRSQYLLDGHGDRHTILLPAIVIPEIAGAPNVRGTDVKKDERLARITKATNWIRSCNFVVAELSERTARRAAEIAIDWELKGPDATILATAEEWGCKHLYACDGNLLKCDGQFPFKISRPPDLPKPPTDLFNQD